MSAKTDVRQRIRSRVKLLSPEEIRQESTRLMKKLIEHPLFQKAQVVMLYCSLHDEIDTHALIRGCCQRKIVLLPVVDGDNILLKVCQGMGDMRIGAYGIEEPIGETFEDVGSIDLIIVPGMAFDRHGNRLGRGKGFYDRFLSDKRLSTAYKIGVCFSCQLLEEVPKDEHDVKMDEVITPSIWV